MLNLDIEIKDGIRKEEIKKQRQTINKHKLGRFQVIQTNRNATSASNATILLL